MIGQKLRNLREDHDLKQADIAQLLDITKEAYSMYESGKRQIGHESLLKLAEYYQVSLDYLYGRIANPTIQYTKSELAILDKFRELDARGKENILQMLQYEYNRKNSMK